MYEGICVAFESTTQHWFSYFQNARKYSKYFMNDPINTIFDDFSI